MEKVDLKFGFLCNNNCLFCVQGEKRKIYGDIPFDELVKTLETARKDSDRIVFTGGEVTIKKEFIKLVEIAKKLDYKLIQIQTNGRMFSVEKFCDETVKAGANEFSLALHGHSPECHDYLTRAQGSYYQTIKGIKNLKKIGQYVGTNTVITRSNYRNLKDIAELLVYLKVDQFQLAFVHALGNAALYFKQIVPRISLAEPYVKLALTEGIRAGIRVMTEAITYCFMENFTDYIAEKIIPRTKIYDVKIIDDYSEYRINEGKIKNDDCRKCIYYPECEGPWREYPENYGWNEFVPVASKT
jgi:MoaA/NifB/PqqE/SkfB family radical SAM enzyme